MNIYYRKDRVIIIPENEDETISLNKLVSTSEKSNGLMVWWGDVAYKNKEMMGVNIAPTEE